MAMFGKEPATRAEGHPAAAPEAALSIISGGVKIVGDIQSTGILKVDGIIEGSVRGARQVLLGRSGTIRGDVSSSEAVIAGTVHGSISASDRLELQSTAVVNGDIDTKSIVVLEGARINGVVRMNDSSEKIASSSEQTHEASNSGKELGSLRLAT